MWRRLVWLAAAAVVIVAGYWLLQYGPDPRSRDAAGHCLLRARAYVDPRRRMLGMQNLEDADWADVSVTISGIYVTGPQANQPTGSFVQNLPLGDSRVAAHEVREIHLENFQGQEVPRWIPITMRVDQVGLRATIAGEACTAQIGLPH